VIFPSSAECYLSTTLFTNIKEECEKWPVLWLLYQKKNLCTMYRRFMYLKLECHPNSHLQAIILLLLVDPFLHTLMHFAWYKYCTHVFSVQKNNAKQNKQL
jgi:hypothetical protein